MFSKIGNTSKNNKVTVTANTLESQGKCVNSVDINTCQPQDPETMSIPYLVNQPNTS